MARTRSNPFATDILAPFAPWLIVGAVLYFFGDKIMAAIAGVSTEEFKEDASTVKSAIMSPVSTASDILRTIKVATGGYISPAEQAAAIAKIGQTIRPQAMVVPYPNPQSQVEFRANIDAINKALGKTV